ncbi:MAG: sulfotransferase [Chitinophagales bacterium]|nr:sulfotransferase [Chitinophagales bacterium]
MSFIHASIFYIHIKTFVKIVYLQCIKHFSIRRFLFTLLFVILFVFVSFIVMATRFLDEIFFPNYRKINIKEPIFIIANPRSGTTFLHRLFCLDQEKYGYTLLYHTILPSITIFKIIDIFGAIDKKIGHPLRKTFDYLDGLFFKGWEEIHPMGFNKSEEDEGTFIFTLITSGIFLLCPFMDEIDYVKFPDLMSEKEREKLSQYYKASIQRFMYSFGMDKIFLSKNVMSTGRLNTIIDLFPDTKIVYIVRSPYKAVPSFISMFSAAWKAHSPEIPENSKYHRAWGELAMDYYLYFHEHIKRLPQNQWYTLKYEDLVENPEKEMIEIYRHFNLSIGTDFELKLRNTSKRSKSYQSTHQYSLEQYGLSKNEVLDRLEAIFDKYSFEK